MKRNAIDSLRRGFDNAVANWPLLLLRFAETAVSIAIVVASIIAVVVPLVVSAGLSTFDFTDASSAAEVLARFFVEHWIVIVYLVILLTVVSFILMAVHSFVVAGAARVLVDADGATPEGAPRERFALFSIERWLAGAKRGWWPVFWIYNVAYFVAFLVICAPILFFLLIAVLVRSAVPALIVAGCFGVAVTVLVTLATGIVTTIWVQKAIVIEARRRTGANAALQMAWRDTRSDFLRHFTVGIAMLVIGFAISSALASLSLMFSPPTPHGAAALLSVMLLPARIATTFVSSVFSAALSLWWIASFAALEKS